MVWTLHFLNARGTLDNIEPRLRTTLGEACDMLGVRGRLLKVDIVVRGEEGPGASRLAVGGRARGPGVIEFVINLDAITSPAALHDEVLKALFHEYHHALRWEGPGYGHTLGEALVSEGLAQAFVHEMLDCPPEPWETLPPGVDLGRLCQQADAAFDDPDYPHDTWFFGSGDLPEWTGYALGSTLVAAHLGRVGGATALDLAHAPAAAFRELLAAPHMLGRGRAGR